MSEIPITIDNSIGNMPLDAVDTYRRMSDDLADNYRLNSPFHVSHLINSKAQILSTAEEALSRSSSSGPRTAIILGAGHCHDIPIHEIAEAFDHTTFVEADAETTEHALSSLPSTLLGRVSIVGADVTGGMTPLMGTLRTIGQQHTTFDTFTDHVVPFLETFALPDTPPTFGQDHTFVCSQLLLTQLIAAPTAFMEQEILEASYGQRLFPINEKTFPLHRAITELGRKIQTSHITHLAKLISKTGAVHFADTIKILFNENGVVRSAPMVDEKKLNEEVNKHFSKIFSTKQWAWTVAPDTGFLVSSYSLSPRKN